jgi:acyl-coenzyme A synthetase/AMP-(fatty) acid ligase
MIAADGGPDKAIALIEPGTGTSLTYGQLHEAIGDVRQRSQHLVPGRLLLLSAATSIPAVITYLAALEAGCAVALLDPKSSLDHAARLERAYRPDFMVGTRPCDTAEFAGPFTSQTRSLEAWTRIHPEAPVAEINGLLLSTSGSTGNPRMVRLATSAVYANSESIATALQIIPQDIAIANLPLHYSYGLSILNSHLRAGATVVLSDASPVESRFWDIMASHGVTTLAGVPYYYEMYRRTGLREKCLPALRVLTQAGGRLSDERIVEFHRMMSDRGGRFFVMYGQTEATARMAVLPPDELPDQVGSVGRAIGGGGFRISEPDSDGRGEVVYKGPNVMLGYSDRREDLHRGDELGGVLRTGDMGYMDAENRLWLTGRAKRIAKLFGVRISLDDVEAMLASEGPTAVVERGDRLVVYCEWGDTTRHQQVRRTLARTLGTLASAIELRQIERLPRASNGKIAYPELLDDR